MTTAKLIICLLISATMYKTAFAQVHTNNQPLFAFCHDTHDAKKRNMEEQADMLKRLGYAGCGHLWLNNVEPRIKALDKAGLRLFQIYMQLNLQKENPIDEAELTKILPLLKHHKTQLVLLITGAKPSDASFDDKAIPLINRIADLAEQNNLTVVLYPHTNDWLEKCSDAVRIADKINRPGLVGVMFNLCHWMKTDPDRDLKSVLEQAKPWLMAVSLSGSDKPDDVRSGKGNWIQPLDKGSYDITEFTTLLNQIGFTGIIGLQCYGIGGDAETHLKQSMEKWMNI